jgi:hypothetical protein
MSRARKLSTFEQRTSWFNEHPELHGKTKIEVVRAMQKAGLVSPTTYWRDVVTRGWDLKDKR